MNLRDQLKDILPDILPRNPAHAIKGTELIELVKYRLKQGYSDATLRYHFSIMSCDPSSPIAKVEQGQGYYLRTTTIHSLNSARNLLGASQGVLGEEFSLSGGDHDLAIARANKFRAVVSRYFESIHRFPMAFERSFSGPNASANRWRCPDMVAVEWLVGEVSEDGGFALSPQALEVRRRLGDSPMRLTSVKLKLETSYLTLREDLFQALSASGWANSAEVMVAAPIDDEQLVEEIRQFSARYGVGVTTFGLDADVLDDMPEPAAVSNLMPREFEAIQSLFRLRRISSSRVVDRFDWQHIVDQREDQPDFGLLDHWLTQCLVEERAIPVEDFKASVEEAADADGSLVGEQVA
ncbi:MAG: hypothetical protein KDN19_21735 [Verrucomicrobiae bacterium]|nr:hypothetical protein [Verrucomicrobiae bacterium]